MVGLYEIVVLGSEVDIALLSFEGNSNVSYSPRSRDIVIVRKILDETKQDIQIRIKMKLSN